MSRKATHILFSFHSNILDQEMTESLSASVVSESRGQYRISEIPAYAPLVARGDTVLAAEGERSGELVYTKTQKFSGNSVIQVVLMDENTSMNDLQSIMADLGCETRLVNDVYFTMEVPAAVDYRTVKQTLDKLEKLGILDYAESCISYIHAG